MCGPFKSKQNILRLLEIILSTLALIVAIIRGRMVSPYGIWCEFVWVFCIIVPLVILVMEAMGWNRLLAACLPNWEDLCCGLTMVCTLTITSATAIFGAVFTCFSCIAGIFCFIFSLLATLIFLLDAVWQKKERPDGYLTMTRGIFRCVEAFAGCILLTASSNYFLGVELWHRPSGMVWSMAVFGICLIGNIIIIFLHLLEILRVIVPCGMKITEVVYNAVAVVLYLSALITWCVYGYWLHYYNKDYHNDPYYDRDHHNDPYYNRDHHNDPYYNRDHYYDHYYSRTDFITVIVGCIVNLVLYIIDLVLSIMDLLGL